MNEIELKTNDIVSATCKASSLQNTPGQVHHHHIVGHSGSFPYYALLSTNITYTHNEIRAIKYLQHEALRMETSILANVPLLKRKWIQLVDTKDI